MKLMYFIPKWAIVYNLLPDETLCMPIVFVFELYLFAALLVLAILFPVFFESLSDRFFRFLHLLTRKKLLNMVLIGLIAYFGNAAGNLIVRFPEPSIHDEFSKLLAAETFASGRLVNPSHPHWEHFQTFHILQTPTYASKYLPGPSLVLALGQKIAGTPTVGLWIGSFLFSASIYWMLTGLVPRGWGALGGLFAALNFCVLGYWSQKFWGGYVSAIGCSFVYGALFRLSKKYSISASIMCGVGVVFLLLSRPFEGFIAIAPGGLYFIFRSISPKYESRRSIFIRSCLFIGLVIFAGMIWIGYYNYKVSGNVFKLPYMTYQEQYASTPVFLWSEPKPPKQAQLTEYNTNYQFHLEGFKRQQGLHGYFAEKKKAVATNLLFYFRFVLLVPLCTLPFLWKRQWTLVAFAAIALTWGVSLCEYQSLPRKIAPVTSLMVLMVVQGIRILRCKNTRCGNTGNRIALAVVIAFFISVPASFHPIFHSPPWQAPRIRKQIEEQLIDAGGKHIVLVCYDGSYVPHFDYVQNHANIDASPVVWARNLSMPANQKLVDYYPDRNAWILSVSNRNLKLSPYSSGYD